jgi:hypothetical protein
MRVIIYFYLRLLSFDKNSHQLIRYRYTFIDNINLINPLQLCTEFPTAIIHNRFIQRTGIDNEIGQG